MSHKNTKLVDKEVVHKMGDKNSLDEIKDHWHKASEVVLKAAIRDIKDYPPQIRQIIEEEIILRKLSKTKRDIKEEQESTTFRFRRQIKIAGLLLLSIIIFALVRALSTELLEPPYDAYGRILAPVVSYLIFVYFVRRT